MKNPNLLNDIKTKGDEYVIGNGIFISNVGDYHTSPLSNNIPEKKTKIDVYNSETGKLCCYKDMACDGLGSKVKKSSEKHKI